jgi:uncharacterized protein (DUF3820 family)
VNSTTKNNPAAKRSSGWPDKVAVPTADALLALVTRQMPFGKHEGRLIADLPGNYLNWFAREGFPPGELGRLLALMHELDHNGLSSLLDPLRKRPNIASEISPRRSIGKTP